MSRPYPEAYSPPAYPSHLTGERRRDVERPVVRSARFAEPVVADGAPGPVVQNLESALVGGSSIHEPNIPLMRPDRRCGFDPLPLLDQILFSIRIRGADLNLVLGPGGEPGERRPRDRHGLGAAPARSVRRRRGSARRSCQRPEDWDPSDAARATEPRAPSCFPTACDEPYTRGFPGGGGPSVMVSVAALRSGPSSFSASSVNLTSTWIWLPSSASLTV